MNWSRLQKILLTRPLDRETKLMMIDLLSRVTNQKQEDELLQFIFAWDESEAAIEHELVNDLKELMKRYEQERLTLENKQRTSSLSIADDMHREKKIQELRELIKTL